MEATQQPTIGSIIKVQCTDPNFETYEVTGILRDITETDYTVEFTEKRIGEDEIGTVQTYTQRGWANRNGTFVALLPRWGN